MNRSKRLIVLMRQGLDGRREGGFLRAVFNARLNAFVKRFVQTIKTECLDRFVVFGERHLEFLIRDVEDCYNTVRPHQGIENRTIGVIPYSRPTPARPGLAKAIARFVGRAFAPLLSGSCPIGIASDRGSFDRF